MYQHVDQMTIGRARQEASTVFLARVFNRMTLGLAITGVVAYFTANTGLATTIIGTPLFLILILAELGLVFFLSARIEKIQASTAAGLFIGYSVLNGLTLSVIFLAYTASSIAGTFFITAGMFGAMSIYGMVTKRDLTGLGSFLIMGLFGIIIASIVNMFLHNSSVAWMISFLGVLIFTGLTAYDVQKIKQIGEDGILTEGNEMVGKYTVLGALTLYLDFINLFLMLLRFFGSSRD